MCTWRYVENGKGPPCCQRKIWSEWEMSGTSDEGIPSASTGVVIILSVVDERIEHTRFYLDAVT